MSQQHLIGKHIVMVEVPSADNTYAIQQQMSEMVWKKLVPALEILFDRLIDEDTFIQLDSIEIDAGEIDIEAFNLDAFVQDIVEKLEKTIKEKIRTARINQFSKKKNTKKTKGFTELEKKLFSQATEENQEELLKQYQQEHLESSTEDITLPTDTSLPSRCYYFNAWLFWLEKGTLPPYTIPPKENWVVQILETLGIDTDAVTLLQRKLAQSTVALHRLVVQHQSKDLKSIVELYTGHNQKILVQFFEELKKISVTPSVEPLFIHSYRTAEIQWWKHIFEAVILQREKVTPNVLIQKVATYIQKTESVIAQKLVETIETVEEKTVPILHKEFIATLKETPTVVEDTRVENTQEENSVIEEVFEEQDLPLPQFFNNAGVVLLHPFLSSFFRKLELLEGKEFKNNTAQSKAVLLIHFLATGIEQPQEYEMVLPKFLCGMPANIPVDHTLTITDEEKEQANALLQAAIEHWGALGSTTPDGLREGFLTRQGKLEQEQTGFRLYVEHKTLDILLDRLPWSLSIVKLPWMNEFLKVEWR